MTDDLNALNTWMLFDVKATTGKAFAEGLHRGQPIEGDTILFVTAMGTTRYEIVQVQVPMHGMSKDEAFKDLDFTAFEQSSQDLTSTFYVVVQEK